MRKILIVSLLLTVLMSSCVMYRPHNIAIPLLEEQGDMQLDVSVTTSTPLLAVPTLDLSFAYAPLPLLGVQAAASVADFGNYHLQVAAGTYNKIGTSVLECYIGYARGASFDSTGSTNKHREISGYYNMVYSQINLGWNKVFDRNFDWGFGIKGGLMMPNWERVLINDEGTTLEETHDTPHFLLEPQLMMRFGNEKVKLTLSVSRAFLSEWPEDDNYINYNRMGFGAGVSFRF